MTPLQLLPLGAVLASFLGSPVSQEPGRDTEQARSLFLANCASCHGEKGDGKGTADLDRAARSFQAGGFSFGNTQTALFRTLTTGIPGTPMPGFESALSVDQRKLLADYVITLGPPVTETDVARTELAVLDRPVFVRGMLSPLTDAARPTPYGLLLGLPSAQSFEYRTDDVRLLGVRYGGFVRRADWTGRGGSGLQPLGQIAATIEDGAPGPMFLNKENEPLKARFRGSWIEGERAGLTYELLRADGKTVAHVREEVRSRNTFAGLGYTRRFELRSTGIDTAIAWRMPALGTKSNVAIDTEEQGANGMSRTWSVVQLETSSFDCHIGPWRVTPDTTSDELPKNALIPLDKNTPVVIETTHLMLNQYTSRTYRRLKEEL